MSAEAHSHNIIPRPTFISSAPGQFTLTADTVIRVDPDSDEEAAIAEYLRDRLQPSTGFALVIERVTTGPGIVLSRRGADASLGKEGYELTVTAECVRLSGAEPAGLFYAVQTLLQLLPARVASSSVQAGPWTIDGVAVRDAPRFSWRGCMLDVARHFFSVEQVRRLIDQLAVYKCNVLHLHLTDDQGWRLMIHRWPRLAEVGGASAVGGLTGGYYSQQEYADIVEYARRRFVTVVPEVDLPGHTNAALASYAELNPSGTAAASYTGTRVGFSSLDTSSELTYQFVADVLGELAALTPGPYLHIGGDEAHRTSGDDYAAFVRRVERTVAALGKTLVGWEEIAKAGLPSGCVAQHWNKRQLAAAALANGHRLVMSPARHAYMDIKYDADTALGQIWTKTYIDARQAYDWDPAALVRGAGDDAILGVEAPLWTETVVTSADADYMIFPRLPGYAEIGWSPAADRRWEDYRLRLAQHGPRWTAMNVNFYRSLQVPWPALSD